MSASAHVFPSLEHLLAMTDDVGLFQHAVKTVPNRGCGYCLDDVGRALIVAVEAARRPASADDGARLVRTYLAFLHDAQSSDGWFHGFLGYDRRWQDDAATGDAFGRALWGLGYAEAYAPDPSWQSIAGDLRRRAMPGLARLAHLRSHAYAALGLVRVLAAKPDDAPAVRAALAASAGAIAAAYRSERAGEAWEWCEPVMTYDNARLPEALLRAGTALGDPALLADGRTMLAFLARVTACDGVFVPVGNDGWYPRGGVKATGGQQPLEAWATIDAALAAYEADGDRRWRELAELAYAWYAGGNTARRPVADARRGGCGDGIDGAVVNANMGAESTLAYLASAIALAHGAAALRIVRTNRGENALLGES